MDLKMTNKRFETRLRMVIDNEKNFGARVLNPDEIIELLNKVSQPEYDTIRVGREIMDKLAELFKVGGDVE